MEPGGQGKISRRVWIVLAGVVVIAGTAALVMRNARPHGPSPVRIAASVPAEAFQHFWEHGLLEAGAGWELVDAIDAAAPDIPINSPADGVLDLVRSETLSTSHRFAAINDAWPVATDELADPDGWDARLDSIDRAITAANEARVGAETFKERTRRRCDDIGGAGSAAFEAYFEPMREGPQIEFWAAMEDAMRRQAALLAFLDRTDDAWSYDTERGAIVIEDPGVGDEFADLRDAYEGSRERVHEVLRRLDIDAKH